METKKKKIATVSMLFATLALAAGTCFGEDPGPAKHYKLDFTIQEMEGTKAVNTRSYSMLAATGKNKASVRAMNQVPTGSGATSVGANIDCLALSEGADGLSLVVVAEVSGIQHGTTASDRPIIRRNEWNSEVVVQLRKPTIIFSSDDPTSTNQMRVELTATPIR